VLNCGIFFFSTEWEVIYCDILLLSLEKGVLIDGAADPSLEQWGMHRVVSIAGLMWRLTKSLPIQVSDCMVV
jgi:hypothetical protein